MNKVLIDQLLEKYWDAETSIEDEKLLKEYFHGSQIDEAHRAYQEIFLHYSQSTQLRLNDRVTLSEEIVAAYENKQGIIVRIRPLMKYAAAIIFLMASYGLFLNLSDQQLTSRSSQYVGKYTELHEHEDLDEAYAITMEALSFLKTKINQTEEEVTSPMLPISRAINKINQ